MKPKSIFGREPAFWVGWIEAALAVGVLVFLDWSTEQTTLVMAVVVATAGLYTAWATTETMLAVVVGFTKALLALAIGFGFDLAPDTTAALIAFVTVSMGLFNRQVTSPIGAPPPALAGAGRHTGEG